MNGEGEERPGKTAPAPTLASTPTTTEPPPPSEGSQPKQIDVAAIETKLRAMSRDGSVILITGYAAAGKTFSVVQAQQQAVNASFAIKQVRVLIDGTSLGSSISTTKNVQVVEFEPTGENKQGRLYFIDVPGEFFEFATDDYDFSKTDDPRLRQLAACACAADGLIMVLPGPAMLNVRTVRSPAYIGGPTGEMEQSDWEKQIRDVTQSLNLLPHLSHLMNAVSQLQRRSGEDRIGAFQAFCAEPEDKRVGLLKGGSKSDVPLFVLLTKADQVFGLDPFNTAFVPDGETVPIDGSDPWSAIMRANRAFHDRNPVKTFVENFAAVNIDYSSACPGGAERVSEGGIATFRIPLRLNGNGWGVWEPVGWLLERIVERKQAGLDTARLGWLSWERLRRIPKAMLLRQRAVARHGGPASVLRIAAHGDLGRQ